MERVERTSLGGLLDVDEVGVVDGGVTYAWTWRKGSSEVEVDIMVRFGCGSARIRM